MKILFFWFKSYSVQVNLILMDFLPSQECHLDRNFGINGFPVFDYHLPRKSSYLDLGLLELSGMLLKGKQLPFYQE